MFRTHYNSKDFEKKHEVPWGPTLVEQTKCISLKEKIENMMIAGQKLAASRKLDYDFPDGNIDEDYEDPTRQRGFDLADYSRIQMDLREKLIQVKKDKAAKKAAEKASQNVVDDAVKASEAKGGGE